MSRKLTFVPEIPSPLPSGGELNGHSNIDACEHEPIFVEAIGHGRELIRCIKCHAMGIRESENNRA